MPKGREFAPGQSGNPKGRPKKIVNQLLDKIGAKEYTKSEIQSAARAVLAIGKEDAFNLLEDKTQKGTNLERMLCSWVLHAIKHADYKLGGAIFELGYGRSLTEPTVIPLPVGGDEDPDRPMDSDVVLFMPDDGRDQERVVKLPAEYTKQFKTG